MTSTPGSVGGGSRAGHYDAVVIGTGIGGLAAAARLKAGGASVLVLERLKTTGGRFTDVAVDGYHVSTGGIGIETQGVLQEAYDLIGAPFDVVEPPEPKLRYRVGGRDVPAGEKGGLRSLVSSAAADDEEAATVYGAFVRALAWAEPSPDQSLVEWLGTFTRNPDVIGIFTGICEATHGPGERVPARQFIQFIKVQRGYRSFGFARRGNRNFVDALTDTLVERGVEILTRADVTEIHVDAFRARGVTFEHRRKRHRVTADSVISNTGPKMTVDLAGRSWFDPGYLRLVDDVKPMAIVAAVIGAQHPLVDFTGVTIPSLSGTRRISYLATPTLVAPESAPEGGGHLTESYGMVRDESDWGGEVEANLLDLEEQVPGFDRSRHLIRVNCFSGAWPCYHARPGTDAPQKTPVEMLYNVGDGVKPDGWSGVGACAETARLVVDDIMNRRGSRSGA